MSRSSSRLLLGAATLFVVVLSLVLALLTLQRDPVLAQHPGPRPHGSPKPLPPKHPPLLMPATPSQALTAPCSGKPQGALCRSECKGTQGLELRTCDGKVSCRPFVTLSCGPYQCRDSSCLLACSSDSDCATSHVCRQ